MKPREIGVTGKKGEFMANEALMERKRKNTVQAMSAFAWDSCKAEHTHSGEDDHLCGYMRIGGLLSHLAKDWTVKAAKEREKVRGEILKAGGKKVVR